MKRIQTLALAITLLQSSARRYTHFRYAFLVKRIIAWDVPLVIIKLMILGHVSE